MAAKSPTSLDTFVREGGWHARSSEQKLGFQLCFRVTDVLQLLAFGWYSINLDLPTLSFLTSPPTPLSSSPFTYHLGGFLFVSSFKMRFTRSVVAAGLATAATFMAAEASSSSDVLVLGQGNFTENVQNEVSVFPSSSLVPSW